MLKVSKVLDIPIGKIFVSDLHFEREHAQEEIEKLADSIQEVGLIHPITVRKKGNGYELLAGARRLAAVKLLKFKEVRVTLRSCDDITAELLSIRENLEGTEPMTAAEEKRAIDRAVELAKARITASPDLDARPAKKGTPEARGEVTEQAAREKAAEDLGVSLSKVNRIRNLDKLVPNALRAYERNQISKQQAALLAGMTKTEQREQLPKMIRETQKETSNRTSLEKLGGKDSNYKATIREVNKLANHCEAVSTISTALSKELSVEAAADLEEGTLAVLEKAAEDLRKLLDQVYETASWAREPAES